MQDAWAIRIANVSGIPIRLHFTFLLLVIWFALSNIGISRSWMVLSLLGLFFCIVLHELGHSLVAQHFGYRVRDITLYPIGGVAAIEGSPRPLHELYIALAGPAVNVAIAILLYAGLTLAKAWPPLPPDRDQAVAALLGHPLTFLYYSNIFVFLFNMIPAFPMDGGRVLRAMLGLSIGKARATRIAASVGQILAVLMAVYGLGFFNSSLNLGLVIIALFVFFGAGQERDVEQARVVVDDAPVSAAMVRDFQTLAVGDTLERAASMLLATSQQDFPVVVGEGGDVAGVLSRGQLLRGLAEHGPSAYVAGTMTRDVLFALPGDSLEEFMLRPDGVQRAPVLVRDESGALLGMLTMDNLMEFLTLQQIRRDREEEGRG
jgi:Zn-dependent protease